MELKLLDKKKSKFTFSDLNGGELFRDSECSYLIWEKFKNPLIGYNALCLRDGELALFDMRVEVFPVKGNFVEEE